jgi:Cu2+-exporting ATPase
MKMEHTQHGQAPMANHSQHKGAKQMPTHGHEGGHAHMVADYRRRFWISLALTVPILALSPLIQEFFGFADTISFSGDTYVLWGLASVVFFYGGYPFLRGIFGELKARSPGMMTLIALAITVAYTYSSAVTFGLDGKPFFWELATLIDVMLLGHWMEMRSIMGASRALEELARLMPSVAHKQMTNGRVADVPLDELVVGDTVIIKPGERIPADGKVINGESSVNEAMLTGESLPVAKKMGSKAIGGAINGEGSLTLEVQKTGADSYLSQIITLVKEAQESKSRTQDIASRAALWLTIIAISVGAVTLTAWLVIFDQEFNFALERMVTVMVITCPHALGLAVPLVVAVSTSISARKGLLIRDRAAFERSRNIQAIVFDKTGTLTEGRFGVTDTIIFNGLEEKELLKYAASVEARSEHPIARGIVSSSGETYKVESFKAISGVGAQGLVNGRLVKVVSPGYLRDNEIPFDDTRIEKLAAQGKTVIFILIDDKLAGAVVLADIIRPESKRAIARLKEMGIRCLMITGDNQPVARWVAEETGLDEYFAEVLPHEKTVKVKDIQARGLTVAMTGDGVNDAPALAQADVGIAIGAGTDVAVAAADVILVRSNPLDVVSIIGLARATYRKMVQNLGWATGYNLVAIPLAAGVAYGAGILLSPALGAALMSLSTVIVAINARLLKIE